MSPMQPTRLLLLLLLFLVVVPTRGRADDTPAWSEALDAYLHARDPDARRRHAESLKQLAPEVATVADRVAGAWRWDEPATTGAVTTWERETPDGVVHTLYAYVPESYDPDRPWPALLYLHGDVTRDSDGGGEEGIRLLADTAESEGFLLLCPSTQDGSHWWMPNGRDLIHGALRDLKRRYRVDADRVAAMGRSDGASACFNLLVHTPDPFCCFLAFVGNPLVTDASGGPTWTTNLAVRPVYAVNGGRDPLYPSRRVAPHVEALRRAGCRITWIDEPEAAHDLSFLERRWPEIRAFWTRHPRVATPAQVTWTTSSLASGRRAWVEITRLDPAVSSGDGIEALDFDDPGPVRSQPRIGVRFDATYEGPGLLVDEVEEETAAAEAGFVAGDVLLRVGPRELLGPDALASLRSHLAASEDAEMACDVLRGTERIELALRPRPPQGEGRPSPEARGYGMPARDGHGRDPRGQPDRAHDRRRRRAAPAPPAGAARRRAGADRGAERTGGVPRPVPRDLDHLLAEASRNGPGDPVAVGCLELDVTADAPPR